MLPRKPKLRSIRDPNVQGDWLRFHQPRSSLTLASNAYTGCGALTLINAPHLVRRQLWVFIPGVGAERRQKKPITPRPIEATLRRRRFGNVVVLLLKRRIAA
jgi:hypothetical protein